MNIYCIDYRHSCKNCRAIGETWHEIQSLKNYTGGKNLTEVQSWRKPGYRFCLYSKNCISAWVSVETSKCPLTLQIRAEISGALCLHEDETIKE